MQRGHNAMKTIVLIAFVYFSALCARAQPTIQQPNALTCLQVNYTYNDGAGNVWSSMGKYWMNSQWGDNKSFFTVSNQPFTLMRLTYGGGVGSISENCVINTGQQSCTVTSGNGVGSIFTTIAVWGKYMGTDNINGITCYKWFAYNQHDYFSGQYYLWTTADSVFGYHMPVRQISTESNKNSPKQTLQMDFPTMCTPQTPPDSVFALPDYCPGLTVPVSSS